MSDDGDRPARVVMVTGHVFGIRAFEGVTSAPAYLEGRVEIPLVIGLDAGLAGGTVGYHPVRPLAEQLGVRCFDTTDGRLTSHAGLLRELRPDYVLVIGWSRLVSTEVLGIPAAGCVGMHPTRLPSGRGQAPIPWTIIKGLRDTALSVFFLEAGADTGAVIARHELSVHPRETALSLFNRVAQTHFTAGFELAAGLGARSVRGEPQDPAEATVWGKRRPADGEITPDLTADQVDALVRALLGPYPRAFAVAGGTPHPVVAVERATGDRPAPGRLRFTCADAVLDLVTTTP
ncbi:MAG TPA: formyltransferase family protein [Pseudonocardiaceae bacterium]